jgi:hypothetical protein
MADFAGSSTSEQPLTIDQVARLRGKTEAVSELLSGQLAAHLETLRPILTPRRVLGKHVRTPIREDIPGADRAYNTLREKYAAACGRPFGLPKELEEDPLTIEARLEIYPWEYTHTLSGEDKAITMTSPVRWVVSYRSGYSLNDLREALATRKNLRTDDARQFVINALVFQLLLDRYPEIQALLADLRYRIEVDTCDGLGQLPVVTISSALPSFRPTDDLIATATSFSGVPAFIELLRTEAVATLEDPLKTKIEAILG